VFPGNGLDLSHNMLCEYVYLITTCLTIHHYDTRENSANRLADKRFIVTDGCKLAYSGEIIFEHHDEHSRCHSIGVDGVACCLLSLLL
jgi:hypothetical protein